MIALFAGLFVVLHTVDGGEVAINPPQVTSLRAARDNAESKHFTGGVRCMVSLSDGKFVTVIEACDAVRHKLQGAQSTQNGGQP
ncbi:hypothetical protein J4G48_0014585 [Bradyrhizobium barranii subsp. apii]|uniref:hypothetical protein n=1 Tax=Bradyrhizobium barranii TaxID=2992140 RepID=UPI001AA17FCE|nr:hypothetical protein [Bradyrhizobium barranii]UPT99195.1 hypothetical protein J4G48_0014585 [Bradyrhizobium barranii subsp. apii]